MDEHQQFMLLGCQHGKSPASMDMSGGERPFRLTGTQDEQIVPVLGVFFKSRRDQRGRGSVSQADPAESAGA
jgi:hypothetical protein